MRWDKRGIPTTSNGSTIKLGLGGVETSKSVLRKVIFLQKKTGEGFCLPLSLG